MKSFLAQVREIIVYHAGQCDPKKCTGTRLGRMNKAKVVKNMRFIPRGSVVLNPVSEVAFSPADKDSVLRSGLVALDCSWKQAEKIFAASKAGVQRSLPYLLAANPINSLAIDNFSFLIVVFPPVFVTGFSRSNPSMTILAASK